MVDQVLHTHAALRLSPPTKTAETRWTVSQLMSLRRFTISLTGCMVLVAFVGGRNVL